MPTQKEVIADLEKQIADLKEQVANQSSYIESLEASADIATEVCLEPLNELTRDRLRLAMSGRIRNGHGHVDAQNIDEDINAALKVWGKV